MIKGILLDIDGTLVLSNAAHAHSWVDAFSRFGYTVPFDATLRLIGMGSDKLISDLQPDLKAANGSRELVETLREKGIKMVAASSSSKKELDTLLRAAGIQDILAETTTSDDADNSKPDPDIIKVALQKIDLAPDEAVMIGDTPYDIESCAKAGVKCIAVRCGGWDAASLSGAVAIYNDPSDVLRHLDRILE
jgi:HAD superfamily hydrolase (TIGR01549 family)